MPDVTVCECWSRDGIQGWPAFVPTADKLRVIREVAAAGVSEIDATSFVPAATVPQFADAEELLTQVPAGLSIRVLTVNVRGVQRAVEAVQRGAHIDLVGFPISASEPHNIVNLRRDHRAHLDELAEMVDRCLAAGMQPLLGIATAFGCPIQGRVEPDDVLALARWGGDHGVTRIMLGDTTGMADPRQVRALFSAVMAQEPQLQHVAHFHDNRGRGMANTLAALDAGVRIVDCCLGGVGGEPAIVEQDQAGELGNVSSEDLVAVLDQMGIVTGIDAEALLSAGELAEKVLGVRLRSQVLRAGLARM